MSAGGPLAGRTIVVTRPEAQAASLAEAIGRAGGRPLVFPLLEISAAADSAPLSAALAAINDYAMAVFISPNAVAHSVPALLVRQDWPAGLQPAAVGQGTARALAALGVGGCIVPGGRFDSEALLAQPEMAAEHVAGRRIVIFRGDGGRELLAETLRERGATVDCIPCYRRAGPSQGVAPLLTAWQSDQLDALTVSSSEGLRYLFDLLDDDGRRRLHSTPIFVPHPRIAENAAKLGLHRVVLTAAADAGIIDGLCAYHWDGDQDA